MNARLVRAFLLKERASRPITVAEMIRLHKLAHEPHPFHLNPDLVATIEANPDTVVALTTGSRLLVMESPEEVAGAVRAWRASILDAMARPARRSTTSGALALVRGTVGDPRPRQPDEEEDES